MKLTDNQKIFKEDIIVFPEDGAGKPYLAASKCPSCGKVYFPQKDFCPLCVVREMAAVALGDSAVLYTFTVVHMGVKGFKTPYVLGWVEYPEEKLRIAAQILTDPETAAQVLRTGQKLALNVGVLRTLEDGTEVIGYRYEPVA